MTRPGQALSPASLFCPWDMEIAAHNFEAMCGHGALAAALGMDVCSVMQFFGRGGWVNFPQMDEALRRAGKIPAKVTGWVHGPRIAVTLIQFTGPWMKPGVPAAARCQHRHWIATFGVQVWDANTGAWQDRADWEKSVIPDLMPKRGDGWEPFRSLIF